MKKATAVPKTMANLLARVFGAESTEARSTERTPAQWRRTLHRLDEEILAYVDENVHTDPVHEGMLHISLMHAEEALQTDDFWPGYSEAIIRLALFLMGDCPDHRSRGRGGTSADHYCLRQHRSLAYTRSPDQKYRSLYLGRLLQLSDLNPRDAWYAYYQRVGRTATRKGFMRWYRENHSTEYAKLF
jgi:hypothetical protein